MEAVKLQPSAARSGGGCHLEALCTRSTRARLYAMALRRDFNEICERLHRNDPLLTSVKLRVCGRCSGDGVHACLHCTNKSHRLADGEMRELARALEGNNVYTHLDVSVCSRTEEGQGDAWLDNRHVH